MNQDQLKEMLRDKLPAYVEMITKKSKGNLYVCPLCGSGEGRHGTGAFSIKGNTWKCFSGKCGKSGDLFDLIGEVEGLPSFADQAKRAAEIFGLDYGNVSRVPAKSAKVALYQNQDKIERKRKEPEPEIDYTDFFLQAHQAIGQTNYLQQRGLSREVIDRFNLGFVFNWKNPKAPNSYESSRVIIPTSNYSYVARAIDPENKNRYQKVGSTHFFNIDALTKADRPIFIVEGEIDALSIMEVGGEAIGLGSAVSARAFVDYVKSHTPVQPLILALDNDDAGNKAKEVLLNGLLSHKIDCYSFNPYGEYKDANEALIGDRSAFTEAVEEAENVREEAEKSRAEIYKNTSAVHYLDSFLNSIHERKNGFIPTGLKRLDEELDGGLYSGLYCIGAISSLGKTTLITQIADQIAESGKDVLIFSLEMAREELMAKSISRLTLKQNLGIDNSAAKTVRGILSGSRYEKYSQKDRDAIYRALTAYSTFAHHLYIVEGLGNIGVEEIKEVVRQHKTYTGNTPVVIVDYLQILAPYSERATDKQNTDKAILELKRLSRDMTVIGISSFNRANYSTAVSMEAFKESGAIEYCSDVLLGLQLSGAGGKDFDPTEEKKKNPREIELVILKNRNGRVGEKIPLLYYPMFNFFDEP